MDIDPKRSLSQNGFCYVENISKAKYYELKKRGLAPDETNIDGLIRITPKAREVARAHGRIRKGRGCAVGSRAQALRTSRHRRSRSGAIASTRLETKTAKTAEGSVEPEAAQAGHHRVTRRGLEMKRGPVGCKPDEAFCV